MVHVFHYYSPLYCTYNVIAIQFIFSYFVLPTYMHCCRYIMFYDCRELESIYFLKCNNYTTTEPWEYNFLSNSCRLWKEVLVSLTLIYFTKRTFSSDIMSDTGILLFYINCILSLLLYTFDTRLSLISHVL